MSFDIAKAIEKAIKITCEEEHGLKNNEGLKQILSKIITELRAQNLDDAEINGFLDQIEDDLED